MTLTIPSSRSGLVLKTGDTMSGPLVINGGTVVASSPVLNLTQTWNDGAVAFTADKLNITDTASASGSLIIDRQVGGVSRFSVTKAGLGSFSSGIKFTYLDFGATGDTFLQRSAAGILDLRNGANAQTFRTFGTYTDGSNYRALTQTMTTGGAATISASGLGTGASGNTLLFSQNGSQVLGFSTSGNAAFGQSISILSTGSFSWNGRNAILAPSDSQYLFANNSGTDVDIFLKFGVDTSAAAGIKRVGTTLQTRLNDDSDFARVTTKGATITGGTVTASAPVLDLSQTWNNGAVSFVGANINVVNTASALTSYPFRIQIGGSDILYIRRDGFLRVFGAMEATGNVVVGAALYIGNTSDVALQRDAAGVLALRNSTAAQTWNVYGTYTDASNYRRLRTTMSTGGAATIAAEGLGTGVSGNTLNLSTDGVTRFSIDSASTVVPASYPLAWTGQILINGVGSGQTLLRASSGADVDHFLKLGINTSAGAGIKRVGTALQIRLNDDSAFAGIQPLSVLVPLSSGFFGWTGGSYISGQTDGIIRLNNNAGTGFTRLNFGGDTASFPALRRTGADIEAVLADNSAFAGTRSLYDRFGSGTPEGVIIAPVGTIYHRTDGASGTSLYIKKSGSGNTGWVGTGSFLIRCGAAGTIPRTTTGCGVSSTETATNKVNYDGVDFDSSASEYANFWEYMPADYNGGTITAEFTWTAASGSGTVIFGLQARSYADGDAIDQAFGTAQTATDTLITATNIHYTPATSAITIAGTPAAGALTCFQVYRDISDTLAVDATIIAIKVTYNI